jgi:CDP-diacylglycerol--serine O-phosphatidyltransferase
LSTQNKPARGIYLLPNIFTTVSLFSAYYSIVAAMQHHYEVAVIAMFIGMIADSLDGRVARLTNTQSEFGAHYDSLSDMVTFGVAPSLLAYNWALASLGKVGWLCAFIYTASVALRLARFNTQIDEVSKQYFVGLNAPCGAGVVASFIWFMTNLDKNGASFSIVIAAIMIVVSLLMVSNVQFSSFKEIDFKGKVPFRYVLLVILVLVAVAAYPSLVLLIAFILYALSGPCSWLYRKRSASKDKKEA